MTFTGVQLPNRVDTSSDQRPAMNWWRVRSIDTETGGRITVTYEGVTDADFRIRNFD